MNLFCVGGVMKWLVAWESLHIVKNLLPYWIFFKHCSIVVSVAKNFFAENFGKITAENVWIVWICWIFSEKMGQMSEFFLKLSEFFWKFVFQTMEKSMIARVCAGFQIFQTSETNFLEFFNFTRWNFGGLNLFCKGLGIGYLLHRWHCDIACLAVVDNQNCKTNRNFSCGNC